MTGVETLPGRTRVHETAHVYGLRVSRGELTPAVQVPPGCSPKLNPRNESGRPEEARVGVELCPVQSQGVEAKCRFPTMGMRDLQTLIPELVGFSKLP